jgi:hypothetical protein
MTQWTEFAELLEKEYVPKKEYEELKARFEELQKTVNCDYYEAYLQEKLRREALESKNLNTRNIVSKEDVHQVAGFEYYDHH